MKKIPSLKHFLILVAGFLSLACFAQSKEPYEMTVSGVKVIVQPSGNEIVELQTIIKGGVQNYPLEKSGIESLAMSALTECGTIKDDKNTFKNKLDKVSAQVYGYTDMDYAVFTMNCIKMDVNVVWPLYTDALVTPRFDQKEFDRIKQDAINYLKAQNSSPDYSIQKLAKETAFAGKDYGKTPEGTEETVGKLTASETMAYYKTILTKSRMLIVVVADLEKSEIEKMIQGLLETIPAGSPFTLKKDVYSPKQNTFVSEKKELATNYIQAVTGGPSPGTQDYNAYSLAMQIFSNRHFLEIRTNNGLSYAPHSYFNSGLVPYSNIGVSTTDPNKYISVLNTLIAKTKKEGFTEEEVKNMKSTYLTQFYYGQETNYAQASALVRNEILHNNWRRTFTLNNDLKTITPADVQKAFNKYISNLTWVYQGDPSKVNAALYTGKKEKLPTSKLVNKTNQ